MNLLEYSTTWGSIQCFSGKTSTTPGIGLSHVCDKKSTFRKILTDVALPLIDKNPKHCKQIKSSQSSRSNSTAETGVGWGEMEFGRKNRSSNMKERQDSTNK